MGGLDDPGPRSRATTAMEIRGEPLVVDQIVLPPGMSDNHGRRVHDGVL